MTLDEQIEYIEKWIPFLEKDAGNRQFIEPDDSICLKEILESLNRLKGLEK